jgi:hypothetical protein
MAQGQWQATTRLISAAQRILAVEQPMTLRQLFYRLVSTGEIQNTRADYQRLSSITSRARERGEIPFEYIVDRSRPEYAPYVFDNTREYLAAISNGYRRNYWADQPVHVEIWTEKDALTGSISDVTNELGVTVRVGRGFVSASKAYEIAALFGGIKKLIHVFYLGDHDPSGRCIESEIRARVQRYGSGSFRMRRLAIHRGDIRKFRLPPLRIKDADPRAAAFFARHGANCVEVDALPPSELRRRIKDAVVDLMDTDRWNRAVAVERVEQASIANAVAAWPSMRTN